MGGIDCRIAHLKARQVLDSDGRPSLEVDVVTRGGALGRSCAPTGNSVGKNESLVMRDGDPSLFGGKSVYKAMEIVEQRIAPCLVGLDVTDQVAIDNIMLELDPTPAKELLGGNCVNAVSFAAARAGARCANQPLYQYLAGEKTPSHLFTPVYNLVNGGSYYGILQPFQEFIVIPCNVSNFEESVRIGVEMFYKLDELIANKMGLSKAVMGKYCGHGAFSADPFEILDMMARAAQALGYSKHVCFGLDCAASEFYDEQSGTYHLGTGCIDRTGLIALLAQLAREYPIGFIEDPLQEEDFEGFRLIRDAVDAAIIGDDFLCTNLQRAQKAFAMGAMDGMIVKPNQVGTLTETVAAIDFLHQNGQIMIASGRSGGPLDDPTTDLAVAFGGHMLKTGAPRSGERIVSINDGLHIAEELGGVPPFDVLQLDGFSKLHQLRRDNHEKTV